MAYEAAEVDLRKARWATGEVTKSFAAEQ